MHKLINAYRKLPSPTNRAKLAAYLDRHMMALCLANEEETAFLRAHGFIKDWTSAVLSAGPL